MIDEERGITMPIEIKKFHFKDINSLNSTFLSNVRTVFSNPTDSIY